MRKRVFLFALLIASFASAAIAEVDKPERGAAIATGIVKHNGLLASASIVCARGGAIAASVAGGTCVIYAPRDSRGANLGMEAIVCRNKASGDYAWVNCVSGCVGTHGSGRCAASGF